MESGKKYTSFKYGLFEKMLDEWLGVERNGDGSAHVIKSYNDERVCKYSLAGGICPFALLENTRFSRGPCRYQVCPCPTSLREQYIEENRGFTTSYDQKLFDILDSIIVDADKRVAMSKNFQQSKPSDLQTNPEITALELKINNLLRSSREHGKNGDVDLAISELNEADIIRKRITQKEQELMKQTQERDRQVHVCDVCTAVIQQSDQEGRMAEHNVGRQHVAFMKIRECYEMLKSNGVVSKRRNETTRSNRLIGMGPSVRRLVPLDMDAI